MSYLSANISFKHCLVNFLALLGSLKLIRESIISLQISPITIAVDASSIYFRYYKSGIIDVNINGTIYVGTHGFRYHEAFHSVFRMLLTPEEQKQYLAIAKKELRAKLRREGKNFEVELQNFRNLSALYKGFSRARLEKEFIEEYMADEFEKFKQGPKNSTAGGFIKSLLNSVGSQPLGIIVISFFSSL